MSDYVLLDYVGIGTERWTSYVLDSLNNRTDFKVYAIGGPAVLFKRGFEGSSIFVPNTNYEIFYGYSDLMIPYAETIEDATSHSGTVAFYPKGTSQQIFFYGPYVFLPPGRFEITFEVKFGQKTDGYLATLDVSENYGERILSTRDIYGFENIANSWANYTVDISCTELRRTVEFRMFTEGSADIYLDRVILRRVSEEAEVDFGTVTYSRLDLVVGNSTLSDEGFIVHQQGLADIFMWYGPYVDLPFGHYTATFFLRTSSVPPSTERILTIDVAALYGQAILVARDIFSTDILGLTNVTGWHSFTLEFEANSPILHTEFRGFDPSPDVDIYLGFILVERID